MHILQVKCNLVTHKKETSSICSSLSNNAGVDLPSLLPANLMSDIYIHCYLHLHITLFAQSCYCQNFHLIELID